MCARRNVRTKSKAKFLLELISGEEGLAHVSREYAIIRALMTALAFVLVSCTPPSSATPSVLANNTPTGSAVPAANASKLAIRCARMLEDTDLALFGELALVTFKEGTNSYLFDLETNRKIDLGISSGFFLTISPDGSKVAFSDLNRKALVIADASGKQIKTIADPGLVMGPTQWLDNDHLAIDKRAPEGGNNSGALDELEILNPATGETREFLPDYPALYSIPGEVNWGTQSRLSINDGLIYLVYPALNYETPVILWDIRTSREVARVHWGDMNNTPQWAPDETHFITSAPVRYVDLNNKTFVNFNDGLPSVGGDELLQVSQTGEIKRLTFLTTQYTAREQSYVWSPNGQFIAFAMKLDGDSNNHTWQLGIADVSTGETTNYCISGVSLEPVWSPNGKFLAISISADGLKHEVFVMDVEKAITVRVAEDAVVQGWIVAGK